jgi:hypothetical protein
MGRGIRSWDLLTQCQKPEPLHHRGRNNFSCLTSKSTLENAMWFFGTKDAYRKISISLLTEVWLIERITFNQRQDKEYKYFILLRHLNVRGSKWRHIFFKSLKNHFKIAFVPKTSIKRQTINRFYLLQAPENNEDKFFTNGPTVHACSSWKLKLLKELYDISKMYLIDTSCLCHIVYIVFPAVCPSHDHFAPTTAEAIEAT